MNSDLKWVKKHYSEKLMHICRELFPTLLEQEGLLKQILSEHFAPSKSLGRDIEEQDKISEFKNYIYSFVDAENEIKLNSRKTAEELMDEAGYILYPECQTEADIQSFRHYYYREGETPVYTGGKPEYRSGEELCTFNGGRLGDCRVWFAVKKDVDAIKREDFKNPTRQDEYGTSVISIQFSRGESSTLSIKNRYNHTVNNPDSTFGNNLDDIIPGLTRAFIEEYNITLSKGQTSSFELKNYVRASDGKYYRFNMEVNNIYYCENNVIIDHFEVKKLEPRYVLMDYFVVDLSTNTIKLYDKRLEDSFMESLGEIEKITYEDDIVRIKVRNGEDVLVTLDEHRAITKLSNPNLTECGDNFMFCNQSMAELDLPNLIQCGNKFMFSNTMLKKLSLPKLTQCSDYFMFWNRYMIELSLPNLTHCGDNFIYWNQTMTGLSLPKLTQCGDKFFAFNRAVSELSLPNLTQCGSEFMYLNASMTSLNLPKLTQCGDGFISSNRDITDLRLPNLTQCGNNFMYWNKSMTSLNLPELTNCGDCFMSYNQIVKELSLPKLIQCGDGFMYNNEAMTELSLPNLTQCGDVFFHYNKKMIELNLPKLTQCGNGFMCNNRDMRELSLPSLIKCSEGFMYNNETMLKLYLPNLVQCGGKFMFYNNSVIEMNLPKLRQCGKGFMDNNQAMANLILSNLPPIGDDVKPD